MRNVLLTFFLTFLLSITFISCGSDDSSGGGGGGVAGLAWSGCPQVESDSKFYVYSDGSGYMEKYYFNSSGGFRIEVFDSGGLLATYPGSYIITNQDPSGVTTAQGTAAGKTLSATSNGACSNFQLQDGSVAYLN